MSEQEGMNLGASYSPDVYSTLGALSVVGQLLHHHEPRGLNQKCSSKHPATDPVALFPWVLGSPGDSFQVKFVWQGAHLTQQDTKPSTPTPGPLPILQPPLILCPGGAGFSACRGSYGRMVCLFFSILLTLPPEGGSLRCQFW